MDDILLAEKELTKYRDSIDVRNSFRERLVPEAFATYLRLMHSADERVAKSAADSVMKIEGSMGNLSERPQGNSINFNFGQSTMTEMAQAFKSIRQANPVLQESIDD